MEIVKHIQIYNDPLERIIATTLRSVQDTRKNKRTKRAWFGASSGGGCKRSAILGRLNADSIPFTDNQLRIFWVGNTLHDSVEAMAKASGKLIASEKFVGVRNKDLVIGAFDLIIRDDVEGNVLYEMKSIGTGTFWTKIMKNKEPSKDHIYQALTYWILNKHYKIDTVRISYLSKQGGEFAAFPVKVTPELLLEVKAWWGEVRGLYNSRRLPPPLSDPAEQRHYCKGCTFNPKYCFANNDLVGQSKAELEENIRRLEWDGGKKTQGEFNIVEATKPIEVQDTELHGEPKKKRTTRTRKKSDKRSSDEVCGESLPSLPK